jgi:PAS domain S-box-containing protein
METGVPEQLDNEFVGPEGFPRWFQLVVQPVPEGIFVLSLDITARKHAEEALLKQQARFEAVVENLHEGLILSDLDGNLLHWNRAALAMLGFSSFDEAREAVAGFTRLFDVTTLAGEPVPLDQRPLARARRGEQFHDLELRLSRPGQQWERVFAYSGSTVQYAPSETLAFVIIRDVTEQKELQQQFIRAQRLESIGTLAGGIAHDLNNILMPILMSATILRRRMPSADMRTIDNIERSAKRGADMVRQILSFARGSTAWSSTIRLHDVFGELGQIASSTFPKTIALAIDVADDLHPVSGDATQLLQVVLNLFVNARDAMPNGGRITASVTNAHVRDGVTGGRPINPGHYVLMEITDQGIGMNSDVLARIFDRFFTTKEPGKGTGLGLHTVQDIVRGHGGFIDVTSQPGKGTTFRIYLPAAIGRTQSVAESEPEDMPRGNGELIMIVDDEASILAVAQQTLETFGYTVVTAQDGAQAIAIYAQQSADIAAVITDMTMGIVDGAALIASLLRMNRGVPVIATSGSSGDDWMGRARSAGARHILAKPYTAPLLLRTVAEILARKREAPSMGPSGEGCVSLPQLSTPGHV